MDRNSVLLLLAERLAQFSAPLAEVLAQFGALLAEGLAQLSAFLAERLAQFSAFLAERLAQLSALFAEVLAQPDARLAGGYWAGTRGGDESFLGGRHVVDQGLFFDAHDFDLLRRFFDLNLFGLPETLLFGFD
jgi:hypothetical protein